MATVNHAPEGESVSVPLMAVPLRTVVELDRLALSDYEAEPLMERGLLPGSRLHRVRNSPSGDPIVSVEGTLLALRRETASQLFVRPVKASTRTG